MNRYLGIDIGGTKCAPAIETYRVHEYHLPMYHWLCAEADGYFFG